MSMNGIQGGCVLPTAQSPVQQVPTAPMPVPVPDPGPDPTPGPDPNPAPWPLPPGPPPHVPNPPNQGSGRPPHGPPSPPYLPPRGGHQPPAGPGFPPPTGPGYPPPPPTGPIDPPPGPPPVDPPPGKDGVNWKPWLIGAGVVGAGIAGAFAVRSGGANVRALQATERAYASGAMHQGGLQAITDAGLGAVFAKGIGFGEYAKVALPGVNRMGTGARLTSVARGHIDHNELLASATALRHTATPDGVAVHEPLRQQVYAELNDGRGMQEILANLDRSANKTRVVFDNKQLARYSREASITERGPRISGQHVTSSTRVQAPELRLEGRNIEPTGRKVPINQIVTGSNAKLGSAGFSDGIGSVQAANISTLSPALQKGAIAASGVDPRLVETIGLRGAYVQRWQDRVAAGAAG